MCLCMQECPVLHINQVPTHSHNKARSKAPVSPIGRYTEGICVCKLRICKVKTKIIESAPENTACTGNSILFLWKTFSAFTLKNLSPDRKHLFSVGLE